ncbi:hypothetical protein AB0A94_08020 [Streptomyces sp. NPDC044984]|uniref:hypothetical protein n=1 Tax=Streptomyces sp. NPDC044984 TaxID=3154335 RepID=UPI0033DA0CB6
MGSEEAGGAVECGGRLVEAAVAMLEDVGEAGPDLECDLDIVGELAITVGAVGKAVDRLVAAGWSCGSRPPGPSLVRPPPHLRGQGAVGRFPPRCRKRTRLTDRGGAPDDLTRIASTLAALRATLGAGSHGRPG